MQSQLTYCSKGQGGKEQSGVCVTTEKQQSQDWKEPRRFSAQFPFPRCFLGFPGQLLEQQQGGVVALLSLQGSHLHLQPVPDPENVCRDWKRCSKSRSLLGFKISCLGSSTGRALVLTLSVSLYRISTGMEFDHPVAADTSGASENQPEPLTVPQGKRSLSFKGTLVSFKAEISCLSFFKKEEKANAAEVLVLLNLQEHCQSAKLLNSSALETQRRDL